MSKLDTIKTILQTLKDAPESVQQPFRDALMAHSDNQWHDILNLTTEDLIDLENDPYTWYREDELESCDYYHTSEILEHIWNNQEELDRLLSKHNEMRLSKDTVRKLMGDRRSLTKDEKDLIEAFLDE